MTVSAAVKYEVRWRVTGTEQWSDLAPCSPVGEIVVEGLDRTKPYDFEVRAVSACGARSAWGSGSNTIPSAGAPTSIDTLTAQSLADGVHLGWTSIATPSAGIESSIERSANGTTGWAERARVRSTAYTDPETSGTTYYYRVRYVNFAGQFGGYSPVASSSGVDVNTIGTNAANALADAAAAQASANAANAALADIASDNLLTPGEKPVVIRDDNVILAEQTGIDAQATAYGITTEKTAYDNAVSALTSYLATLTAPKLWSDLTGNTTIVGATFRSNFANVYTTRQALLDKIYAAAKSLADTAQATGNTAIANAAAAATAASNAQTAANTANAALADIASDNLLTPGEKPVVIRDDNVILAEQTGIDAQATAYGITTEKTAYDSAVTALTTYLATLTAPKLWSDLTGNTTIVGATFRSNFANVYTTRQTLLNAIYAAAKVKADAAQATANTGVSLASQTPALDPNFTQGLTYWTPDGPNQGWFAQSGGTPPNPNATTYASHEGSSGSIYNTAHDPDTALRSNTYAPCSPQQVLSASALINGSSDVNGRALVRFSWRNAAQGEISISEGNSITAYTGGTSRISATAPSGAVYVHVEVVVYSHTGGYWHFAGITCSYQPSTIDEVPDGPTNAKTLATRVSGGNPLIDFGAGYHLNKNLSNIADAGGRFAAAEAGANVTETRTSALTASLSNQTQDNLASGAVYAQMMKSATAETVDNPDFEASATILPPPGWISGGGVTSGYTTGSAFAGAQSLILTATSTFGLLQSVRQYPCIPNEQYLVSAAIANNAVAGNTSSVYMQFFDKTGATVSFGGVANALAPGTGYQVLTQLVTVPASAVTFRLDLILSGVSGAQSFFDNIRLSRARSIDTEIRDGVTYGRTSQTDLYSSGGVNRVGLRVAGSGHVLGNQLNAPNSLTLNLGAVRSTTALTATSAGAISVNAFTYYMGATAVSYNAVSNAVTGASQSSTYYVYCHDAGGTGGTKTWLATTNVNALLQTYDDIVVAGQVTIPTSGSSGGGGGGACVCDDMFVDEGLRAGDARPGDVFDCLDLPTSGLSKFRRALQAVERSTVECVRLETSRGGIWEGSTSTPFDLLGGGVEWAPRMQGLKVMTDLGIETVTRVEFIGLRPVSHNHFGGCSYAAGADPRHRIYSHNLQYKP